jgi:hypothetical protein
MFRIINLYVYHFDFINFRFLEKVFKGVKFICKKNFFGLNLIEPRLDLAHLTGPTGSGQSLDPAPFPPHSPNETLALTVLLAPATVSRRRRCRTIPANSNIGCRRHAG